MMQFTDNERTQILDLIDEGLIRLRQIERDIESLVEQSKDSNPIAKAIAEALEKIDMDVQFETIRRSRAHIRLVKAKIEIEEFSDDDAQEVCDILDEVKAMGKELAAAAKVYSSFLQSRAENN